MITLTGREITSKAQAGLKSAAGAARQLHIYYLFLIHFWLISQGQSGDLVQLDHTSCWLLFVVAHYHTQSGD